MGNFFTFLHRLVGGGIWIDYLRDIEASRFDWRGVVGCSPKDIPRGSEEVDDAVPIGEVERKVQNPESKASQGLRED